MMHMLLGVDATSIGKAPYAPMFVSAKNLKAKEIGLVDELGTLNDAIVFLSKELSMGDDINVVRYPEMANSIWKYITLLESENATKLVQQYGLKNYEELLMMQINMLIERPQIQARMADMYIKL